MKFEPYIEAEKLYPIDRWCRRFVLFVGIPWVLWFALYGCAIAGSYWYWAHPPIPVKGVVETPTPGGRADLLGNANYGTGEIEIRPGLGWTLRQCVISHERKHFAGWSHEERKGFAVDCGDGTMVSERNP